MRRAVVVAAWLGASSVGCVEGEHAQRFAVTVTDAAKIDCKGFADGPFVDEDTVKEYADEARFAYTQARASEPPTPVGNVLYLNELESSVYAWFETTIYEPLFPFATLEGLTAVYVGDPHDGYVEATFEDIFNTDRDDEQFGLEPCGDRPRSRAVLSATLVGGNVEGRVRWTTIAYVGSAYSACDGRVECARDLGVVGLTLAAP